MTWAGAQQRVLRSYVARESLSRLVVTDHYRTLCLLDPAGKGAQLHSIVGVEVERQLEEFDAAISELDAATARHASMDLVLVPDTNVYLHCARPFDELPWVELASGAESVELAVPLLVIDELDKAKQSTKKVRVGGKEDVRTRARTTLRTLEEGFRANANRFELTAGTPAIVVTFIPEGRGYVRLPRPDDELVGIAQELTEFATAPVRLVAYDTGLRLRAGLAGLTAVEPPHDGESDD